MRAHNPGPGCPVLVSQPGRGVSVHQCGRKIVRRGVCGVHAAAEERAEAKDAARAAATAQAADEMAAAKAQTKHLAEALGVDLTLQTYTPHGGAEVFITRPTEYAKVSLADLETLAARLKGAAS